MRHKMIRKFLGFKNLMESDDREETRLGSFRDYFSHVRHNALKLLLQALRGAAYA